jgi:hypothetical protein
MPGMPLPVLGFDTSPASPHPPVAAAFRALLLAACFYALSGVCFGQSHSALCSGGFGEFSFPFPTGVTVTVGAGKNDGFATRACAAALTWKDRELPVARAAWQVDIDLLGADLGLGTPVVAFAIKPSENDARVTYAVYSLQSPPRLLRTVTGGNFFRAADTGMDGGIEIWADDTGSGNAFDGLPLANFDTLPTVVLRLEAGRLMDVSSQYLSFYDRQIAEEKAALDPQGLSAFKQSDGRLSSISPLQLGQLHLLLTTKMKVLDIVWAYLYSGREQDAWSALALMWPAADYDRIHADLLDARAHGIRSQVDGVAGTPSARPQKRVTVFDLVNLPRKGTPDYSAAVIAPVKTFGRLTDESASPRPAADASRAASPLQGLALPKAIYLFTASPRNAPWSLPDAGVGVYLVIDAAGKVNSMELADKTENGPLTSAIATASSNWKFVPATMRGKPVACRIALTLNSSR